MSDLPLMVRDALSRMSPAQQHMFQDEYRRRAHSTVAIVLLAVFLPFFYWTALKRVGMAFLFLFTGGGFVIWWLVEIFLAAGRTRTANAELATGLVRDMKILAQ